MELEMGVNLIITIVGFVVQMVIIVLSRGHYTGKFEQKLLDHELQIKEVNTLALNNYKEFSEHKQKHQDLKTQVAVNDTRLTESMNSMSKEMKELKETFKEFTQEMREWVKSKV